ncbi:MAG: transporter substrate-binding domain-containing protein [Rhodospirillales bacterium]|nr:transporter substrate-binding domain-containing protein [Rhodospirillales bacterium]
MIKIRTNFKQHIMLVILIFAFSLLSTLESSYAEDPVEEVKVGAYIFPPFFNAEGNSGLTVDFINWLNTRQEKYHFSISNIPAKRRYQLLEASYIHMILFEAPEWGWNDSGVEFIETKEIMQGGEVIVAKSTEGRTQDYFKSISDKSIALIPGYHYGFADFNADPDWLRENFNVVFNSTHDSLIELILRDRVDVALIAQSFLNQYLAKHPDEKAQLLISEKLDQIYHLKALVGKASPISANEINDILDLASHDGSLAAFFKSQGLEDRLSYTP